MNLYNVGLSGLQAAQARLSIVGHNMANVETPGYNRQNVLVSSAGSTASSYGFFGRGVVVDSVQRSYNGFLYRQLTKSQTEGASLAAHGGQLSKIDGVLADRTVGVAPAINRLFDALDAVASAPADPAARQELIGQAGSLVTQMNELGKFLEVHGEEINTQVRNTVEQINSYVDRIDDLNRQIVAAKAANANQPPNDLYDQREQVVAELNQLVGVQVTEQDDVFNLSVGNGQSLLSGGVKFPLKAVSAAADPHKTVVAFSAPGSGPDGLVLTELKDKFISGGTLGGLLKFRRESLEPMQNDLGRMAVALAQKFNALHHQGKVLTKEGEPEEMGGDFFSLGPVKAMPDEKNHANQSTGEIGVDFVDISELNSQDYDISFDGTQYTIRRLPGEESVYQGTGTPPPVIDGLQFNMTGEPKAGDHWVLQPTRYAAKKLGMAITDPAKIAAADDKGGSANGENALKLAQLRNEKIMGGGKLSVNEAFSQLVNKCAVQTQYIGSTALAQAKRISLNYQEQQRVSGVNLDEEQVNLDRYQQQFRAAAQIIEAGNKIFDTLLDLR